MFQLAIFSSVLLLAAAGGLYENHQVLHIKSVEKLEHVAALTNLVEHYGARPRPLIVMFEDSVIRGRECTLVIDPYVVPEVTDFCKFYGIEFQIINRNYQATIDESKRSNDASASRYYKNKARRHNQEDHRPDPLDHSFYRNSEQIDEFLADRADNNENAERVSIGNSHLGAPVYALEITATGSGPHQTVYIDSGIHAREWISHATSLYIIDEILSGTSDEAVYLRENFNWYIIPNVNPDGYTYSILTDRMWRKTRGFNAGSSCLGTDGNRNFDYTWGDWGTSTSPCSATYGGSAAFSEIETQNVRDYVLRKGDIDLFISMHSYSQLWLVNWAGNHTRPDDYDDLMSMAQDAVDAIAATSGREFIPGTPPDILYAASGGTFDWAKDGAGIKYSYTPELRPATAIDGGFILPEEQIVDSGEETFAAVHASCVHLDGVTSHRRQ